MLSQKIAHFGPRRLALYEHLIEVSEVDDVEICQSLYAKNTSKAYVKLKTRLYQNLVDIAFFTSNVNVSRESSYDDIRERSIRNLAMLRLFAIKGLHSNILYLGSTTLQNCEKHELYDMATDVTHILLNAYGTFFRDRKKFDLHYDKYNVYREVRDYENMLQVLHYKLFNKQNDLYGLPDNDLEELFLINELQRNVQDDRSFKIKYFSYNLLCLYCDVKKNYQLLWHYANEAVMFLEQSQPTNVKLRISQLNNRFSAELKLKNYDSIGESLLVFDSIVKPGTLNYFIINIYRLIMHMHTSEYAEAMELIGEVKSHLKKAKMSTAITEYINICYAFLAFINLTRDFDHPNFKNFRIFRFLNQVPAYQKDKRGINVSILILHVLFLIESRKYGEIIDRVDALKQYSYRYLRKNDTFRSNCFIKMIIQMTKADFNPIRTERYTAELFEKLKTVPLELSEQPVEVEVIPYEHLWEMVLELLEKNDKVKRGRPAK
jgi:hypothetical protein